MFNFKRQFKKCNRPFIAIVEVTEGYYDLETGKYVPPGEAVEVDMEGITLQLNDDDLRFDEGGTLTTKDKKILLDTDLHTLTFNQSIVVDGDKYQVHHIAPYSLYSHFEKVIIKWVSVL